MSCEDDGKPPNCKEFKCEKVCKEYADQVCPKRQSGSSTGGGGWKALMPWQSRGLALHEKEMIRSLLPSLALYSVATLIATIYFCDWRPIVKYLPFYGGKFADEGNGKEEKKKKKKKKNPAPKPVEEPAENPPDGDK